MQLEKSQSISYDNFSHYASELESPPRLANSQRRNKCNVAQNIKSGDQSIKKMQKSSFSSVNHNDDGESITDYFKNIDSRAEDRQNKNIQIVSAVSSEEEKVYKLDDGSEKQAEIEIKTKRQFVYPKAFNFEEEKMIEVVQSEDAEEQQSNESVILEQIDFNEIKQDGDLHGFKTPEWSNHDSFPKVSEPKEHYNIVIKNPILVGSPSQEDYDDGSYNSNQFGEEFDSPQKRLKRMSDYTCKDFANHQLTIENEAPIRKKKKSCSVRQNQSSKEKSSDSTPPSLNQKQVFNKNKKAEVSEILSKWQNRYPEIEQYIDSLPNAISSQVSESPSFKFREQINTLKNAVESEQLKIIELEQKNYELTMKIDLQAFEKLELRKINLELQSIHISLQSQNQNLKNQLAKLQSTINQLTLQNKKHLESKMPIESNKIRQEFQSPKSPKSPCFKPPTLRIQSNGIRKTSQMTSATILSNRKKKNNNQKDNLLDKERKNEDNFQVQMQSLSENSKESSQNIPENPTNLLVEKDNIENNKKSGFMRLHKMDTFGQYFDPVKKLEQNYSKEIQSLQEQIFDLKQQLVGVDIQVQQKINLICLQIQRQAKEKCQQDFQVIKQKLQREINSLREKSKVKELEIKKCNDTIKQLTQSLNIKQNQQAKDLKIKENQLQNMYEEISYQWQEIEKQKQKITFQQEDLQEVIKANREKQYELQRSFSQRQHQVFEQPYIHDQPYIHGQLYSHEQPYDNHQPMPTYQPIYQNQGGRHLSPNPSRLSHKYSPMHNEQLRRSSPASHNNLFQQKYQSLSNVQTQPYIYPQAYHQQYPTYQNEITSSSRLPRDHPEIRSFRHSKPEQDRKTLQYSSAMQRSSSPSTLEGSLAQLDRSRGKDKGLMAINNKIKKLRKDINQELQSFV